MKYKLLDVELISRVPNSYERMILESDYFAPLDPELLHFLSNLESDIHYKSSYDIWQLGITTLCYIFNEDFNIFYNWNKREIKSDKINQFIGILNNVNYDQNLIKVISMMLDPNQYSRISLQKLNQSLS